MLKIVSPKLLAELSQKANNSPRKRLNHNFHDDLADPINRMLNAFEPGTYIQPHKHENPDKREVFIVLRGSLVVLETGSVVYEVKDGPYFPISDKNFGSWAPKEGDAGCDEYLKNLIGQYYRR